MKPSNDNFIPKPVCANCWRWDETPRNIDTSLEVAVVKTHDYAIGYCTLLTQNTFAAGRCNQFRKL